MIYTTISGKTLNMECEFCLEVVPTILTPCLRQRCYKCDQDYIDHPNLPCLPECQIHLNLPVSEDKNILKLIQQLVSNKTITELITKLNALLKPSLDFIDITLALERYHWFHPDTLKPKALLIYEQDLHQLTLDVKRGLQRLTWIKPETWLDVCSDVVLAQLALYQQISNFVDNIHYPIMSNDAYFFQPDVTSYIILQNKISLKIYGEEVVYYDEKSNNIICLDSPLLKFTFKGIFINIFNDQIWSRDDKNIYCYYKSGQIREIPLTTFGRNIVQNFIENNNHLLYTDTYDNEYKIMNLATSEIVWRFVFFNIGVVVGLIDGKIFIYNNIQTLSIIPLNNLDEQVEVKFDVSKKCGWSLNCGFFKVVEKINNNYLYKVFTLTGKLIHCQEIGHNTGLNILILSSRNGKTFIQYKQ